MGYRCPRCKSDKIIKAGNHLRSNPAKPTEPQYRCKNCGKTTVEHLLIKE